MKKFLADACEEINVHLTDAQTEQFLLYKQLLLEWNAKINLTAITDEKEIMLKHFVDSLTIAGDIPPFQKVIDVGTGAGFPGLPLKIYNNDITLVLLDSLNKRIKFLEAAVTGLGLSNVTCIHGRAEVLGRDPLYREEFDVCVSRAVAALSVLAEYCLPFVKVGGQFIALKGPTAYDEAKTAETPIKLLGGQISSIKTVNLPFTDIKHSIIFVKKIRQTIPKYPRISSKIAKSPIK